MKFCTNQVKESLYKNNQPSTQNVVIFIYAPLTNLSFQPKPRLFSYNHFYLPSPVQMSNQQSQKKILVESIKQSMVKPPTANSRTQPNKKPQNYESYLNTAIDYSKNHETHSNNFNASLKNSPNVYNLDSEDTPKEDQYHKYNRNSNNDDIDQDMMNEIEMEIMRQTNVEEYSPVQRKIVKPVGPKRKINQSFDEQEAEIDSKTSPKPSMARSQRPTRTLSIPITKDWEDQEEESKTITADQEDKPKRKNLVQKKTGAQQIPQVIPSQNNPAKKLKQTLSETSRQVKFSVDIPLLQVGLQIERIVDIQGSTRQDIMYTCRTIKAETVQMNNVEMTYLYKDVLVDYYQNILFTEEQTDDS